MYIRAEPPPPHSPGLAAMCLETKPPGRHLVHAGVVITRLPRGAGGREPTDLLHKGHSVPRAPSARLSSRGTAHCF